MNIKFNQITNAVANKAQEFVEDTKEAMDSVKKTITQPLDDFSYIKQKNKEIKNIISLSNEKIEPARIKINSKLELLGEVKLKLVGTTIEEFSYLMGKLKHLPCPKSNSTVKENNFSFTKDSLKELRKTTLSVKGMLKNGSIAVSGGALSAVAAYGLVGVLGTASTGTIISSLGGIAATNATLAWLGGGALAVGGGGIAMGTLVLGGIAIVPAISYLIWKGKFNFSDKRLEVDNHYKEALDYRKSTDDAIAKFEVLSSFIDNVLTIMDRFNTTCTQLNKQTINILNNVGTDYNKYTKEQQNIINSHTQFIDKLLLIINTQIINEDGALNKNIVYIIQDSNDYLDDSGEIIFKEFKKTKSILRILGIGIIVVCIFVTLFYLYNIQDRI